MIIDPIGDMLTRIRNAGMAKKSAVEMPWSKLRVEVAKVLVQEGFVKDFKEVKLAKDSVKRNLRLTLKYVNKSPLITGLRRISRPGLRRYVPSTGMPKVYGGHGVVIVSTPKGVMTGVQAQTQKVGGELLCAVW